MTAPTPLSGHSWFGVGIDGDVTVNANPFNYTSPLGDNLIVNNVLQRDAAFGSLTIDSGCELDLVKSTACSLICCSKVLTNAGTIKANGNDASGFTAGSFINSAFGQGSSGATGGTGNGASSLASYDLAGAGGAGGAGSGHAGGAASTFASGQIGTLASLVAIFAKAALRTGAGGAAGGGDGSNKGGGGGGGGPVLMLLTPQMDNTAGIILCKGGAGGTPSAGNCGGGGGGGGGLLALVYDDGLDTSLLIDPTTGLLTGTVDVSGGAHGTATGTGTNGTDGSPATYALLYDVGVVMGSTRVALLD